MAQFKSKLSVLMQPRFQKRCFKLFSRSKPKENPYLMVRPTLNEHCTILDQMWQYYYPEEPTTLSIGLGHKYNPVFDEEATKSLAEGLSIVAKCKYNGDIVGALINRTICPWDPDLTDQLACSLTCSRTRQLLHFYAYLSRSPSLWKKYCTNKIFELSQLYVRSQDRGKGVAFMLMEAGKKLGADCGYRVIKVDATNYYTAKVCEKLKMQLALEIPYCSYTGSSPTRQPIFKPPPPHSSCKIYIDTPFAGVS